MTDDQKATRRYSDEPGYWFSKLERADAEGDYDEAAEARRQLARLGWDVKRRKNPEVPA